LPLDLADAGDQPLARAALCEQHTQRCSSEGLVEDLADAGERVEDLAELLKVPDAGEELFAVKLLAGGENGRTGLRLPRPDASRRPKGHPIYYVLGADAGERVEGF
jgi:hypothetical protein